MKSWSYKKNELRHALYVLFDAHKNVEIPSQSNVKSIMAYVEVEEYRIFKVHLLLN
jgi:hypothetical protein